MGGRALLRIVVKCLVAHRYRIVQLHLLVKVSRQCRIVIHGDADDLQATRAVLGLPCNETRHFELAGGTPSGPEIKQYNFAPIGVEIQSSILQINAHELRRFFVEE